MKGSETQITIMVLGNGYMVQPTGGGDRYAFAPLQASLVARDFGELVEILKGELAAPPRTEQPPLADMVAAALAAPPALKVATPPETVKKARRKAKKAAKKSTAPAGGGRPSAAPKVKPPRAGSLPARLVEAIAVFKSEGGDVPTTKDLAEACGADVGPTGQALRKLVAGNVIAAGAFRPARAFNGAHAQ
jgi:hypothetical protein